MRKRVYISGPITCTNYDRTTAIHEAVNTQRELMELGFAPLNPMLSAYLPYAFDGSFSHEDWLECDIPWVVCADAVLRLPGPSDGADRECSRARTLDIPVFDSVDALVAWSRKGGN